ncbi:MAG: hypothetical protein ABSG25_07095, partial [Bryobacteraceae bacterium]
MWEWKPEGRKTLAQCASTGITSVRWEPRYGAKDISGISAAPFRGWSYGGYGPTTCVVGYVLSPLQAGKQARRTCYARTFT